MINVAKVRADINATPGEIVGVPKVQLIEMLAELEIGQHARRSITNIRSLVNVAPGALGAAA